MDPEPELLEAAARGLPGTVLGLRQAHGKELRAELLGHSVASLWLSNPKAHLDLTRTKIFL